jgi:SAM-dependent methyltransferase
MYPYEIDWREMWREKHNRANSSSEAGSLEEHWDKQAQFLPLWSESDEYPNKLLQRIRIQHDWSVLDIGCGMGTIAIAAAIRARRVTTIDISGQMLKIVKKEAERRFLMNIRYVHRAWEGIRVGTDIIPHDVVISSRVIMQTGDLRESLKKIDRAAIRYAYISAWGGETGGFVQELPQALGYSHPDTPDDLYVYNILRQMGISPNVEQIECRNNFRYENYRQALVHYITLCHLSKKEEGVVLGLLLKYLKERPDGKYEIPDTRTVWSLIWWKKPEAGR